MRKLICLCILLGVLLAGNAFAWTTHSFVIGWSDVYTSDGESWKHWHISTIPNDIRVHPVINWLYQHGRLDHVVFICQEGEPDRFFRFNAPYEIQRKAFELIFDPVARIVAEYGSEIICIGYTFDLEVMTIYLHSRHDRDRALYEEIQAELNAARDQLIMEGRYEINPLIFNFLESLRKK